MKYLRYLALAIFTFVIGIVISPIRFYPEMIACGSRISSTSYRSSYFIQTSATYISYTTEEEARKAFNNRLSRALTIYDRSPKVNGKGVLIDQRAVYLTYHPVNDEYYVEIMWLEGVMLHVIHSRSYIHVMDFERQTF